MMTSGLVWAGLFGVLDGIKCSADVVVFGLKKTSQPAAFISEPHRQHERQRLHQTGVRLCGGGGRGQRSAGASNTRIKQIRGMNVLTLRQVRIQSRLPQTCWTLLPGGGALLSGGGALLS